MWRIQSLRDKDIYIEHESNEIPFGTRLWLISLNSQICGLPDEATLKLTISTCYPGKYTCDRYRPITLDNIRYHLFGLSQTTIC